MGAPGLLKLNFASGSVRLRLASKCPDRSDILPIALKDVGLHLVFFDRGRNVFAEVREGVEAFLEDFPLEDIDTHGGLA